MKSKELIIACVLSMYAISFSVMSEESKFCTNPMKTICVDTKKLETNRSKYIDALKEEIAKEAEKNAAPRLKKMKKQFPGHLKFVKRMFKSLKISNQEIMKSAKSRFQNLESVVTNPENTLLLKNYMKQAIDSTNFKEQTRNNYKKIIDSVVIGTFGDYLEKNEVEDNLLKQFRNPCGLDGMAANAFADVIKNQRYVLICPGFLITLSQESNEQKRLNSIIGVLSHEMGHYIHSDDIYSTEAYAPYLSCLLKNYSDDFKPTKDDTRFCKKEKNKIECAQRRINSHKVELLADQWAIKVLAIHARNQQYTTAQTDSLLINNYVNICNRIDEGVHPSSDFRIGTLLRVNPEISDYLSCNNSKIKKPACTFDGAVNL